MSSVESRDRQDVHEGEDDTEEGCHLPEHIPVPHGWEQAADRSKATQRFRSFGSEHIFHVIHIGGEYMPAILNAGREALEETVFFRDGLVDVVQSDIGEAQ